MRVWLFKLFILVSVNAPADTLLNDLSLEEKVGQVLMVHFHGEIANEEAKTLIQELHVGGIIYYNWANGLTSPSQVLNLSTSLHTLAAQNYHPIPLLIAVDQEGGRVARLTQGFTHSPGNLELGMTRDPQRAYATAFVMGQELHAVGINLNLAPVVDINENPRNPIIGTRSFGNSAEIVIPFAQAALQGYHAANIATSLKHFPGHGDVEIDSHKALPILHKSREKLHLSELRPYFALANQTDTIMTAHILVPSLDPIHCATLSSTILSMLRTEIGFTGVIITDSLVMEGILKQSGSVDTAAIDALNAGCDLLLLGGRQLNSDRSDVELTVQDIKRIHQTLVRAVKQGEVTEARLDEAVERILRLKSFDCTFQLNSLKTTGLKLNSLDDYALKGKQEL